MFSVSSTPAVKLGFGGALIILVGIAFISYNSVNSFVAEARWVDHTRLEMLRLEELMSQLEHGEARQRGFLISGNEDFLDPYRLSVKALPGQLQSLQALTTDHPRQQQTLAALELLVSRRLVLTDRAVDLKRARKLDAAFLVPHLAEGRAIMDQIRELTTQMKTEEQRLLDGRLRAFERKGSNTTHIIIAGNAVALVGLLLAFVVLTNDIARRKKAEAQAHQYAQEVVQANAFLDSVFEHIPHMLFVKDAKDLSYVRFNKAGAELLGCSVHQLIGKSDSDFFPPEQAEFFKAKDRETLAHGMRVDIAEEPLASKPRGARILQTKKMAIPGADGKPRYLLGISEDITERKQVERQIQELNAQLQLRAAQLETMNKDLESFSYSISHDLRAPLRAISGYARMLENDYGDKLDPEAARFLQVIRHNGKMMDQLIDDLLAFSKLGRLSLSYSEIDMSSMARAVFETHVDSDGQTATQLVLGSLPWANGDSALLRQVWANLLSNAIKYSSTRSSPVIDVTAHSDGADHIYCVKDNGVGFDMKHYDKLFGVFQRLHSAKEFPGTGVGLAIVERVITRHGGRVWAEAEIDHGATFYFSLPKESGS